LNYEHTPAKAGGEQQFSGLASVQKVFEPLRHTKRGGHKGTRRHIKGLCGTCGAA